MLEYIFVASSVLQASSSLSKKGAISSKCALAMPMMMCRHAHKLILTPSSLRDSSCRILDNSTPVQHLSRDSSEQNMYPRSEASSSSLTDPTTSADPMTPEDPTTLADLVAPDDLFLTRR